MLCCDPYVAGRYESYGRALAELEKCEQLDGFNPGPLYVGRVRYVADRRRYPREPWAILFYDARDERAYLRMNPETGEIP